MAAAPRFRRCGTARCTFAGAAPAFRPMGLGDWAGLAATSLFAAILQATTGFGFAVLAVPFFLMLAPPGEAIELVVVMSLAMSAAAVSGVRRAIEPQLLLRLTAGSLLGLPLGLAAFSHADPLLVRLAAGITVAAFAAVLAESRWRRRRARLRQRPAGDLAAGVVSGIATALVGMSGPPVLIYLMLAGMPVQAMRATLLAFFALVYAATVAAHIAAFGVAAATWKAAASLVPMAWLGAWIGLRLGDRLAPGATVALAIAVLGASGLYTLAVAARVALW